MRWTATLLIAGVLGYGLYLTSRDRSDTPGQRQTEASSTLPVAPKPAASGRENGAKNSAAYRPKAAEVLEEIETLARKANAYSLLPDGDRKWVLEQAANSYLTGQVVYSDLVQHIDELSSIRQFAVLERTETYTVEPDDWRGHAPEGAGE